MQYTTTYLVAALAATSSATNFHQKRQYGLDCDPNAGDCAAKDAGYISSVCAPVNETGGPDFNAPCNAVAAIESECIYGSAGLKLLTDGSGEAGYGIYGDHDPSTLSNATQRECICQSQFFDQEIGCMDCWKKHGGGDMDGVDVTPKQLSSFSSSYCAATNTPSLAFADAVYTLAGTDAYATNTASLTSTFSDPTGNKTAVSLYFTPSVTGSAAWVVAQATESAGTGSTSVSSTSMSMATNANGQIVATADASDASASSASGSTTASGTSSAGGSQQTAAVAGVVALAGFVALL